MLKKVLIVIVSLSAFTCNLYAEGKQYTAQDYRKGYDFHNTIRGKVYNDRIGFHWLEGHDSFWYESKGEDSKRFVLFETESAHKADLFDHNALAGALSESSGNDINAGNLPLEHLRYDHQQQKIDFGYDNAQWQFDLADNKITRLEENGKGPGRRPRWGGRSWGNWLESKAESPDGKWKAYIEDYQLYLEEIETGQQIQITDDGTEKCQYDNTFYWSPDSRKLINIIKKPVDIRQVHYIESSPKDQLQPKHFTIDYTKPGDDITTYYPTLIDIESKTHIPVSDTLFANPYNIGDYHWSPDSSEFYFYYNQRGHQVARVLAINSISGTVRAVIDESTETFFVYSSKKYLKYLDDSNELIWASEADGWNHIYLYDIKTGKLKNQITKGQWVWQTIEHIDTDTRTIYFTANGYYPGQDPYFLHYFKVNFDGSELTPLTIADGTHYVLPSPDRTYFIDTYSRINMPPVYELHSMADGALICEIERADASGLLSSGWPVTEPFMAMSRDDKHEIWGIIHRPVDFDPSEKYPVIESIYAGPHDNHVPKSWRGYNYWIQAICELGFIVVQIDGMGTSNRSREFHHLCWKNLADAGFPDRIKWMKAAAKKYPYMDIENVGIYGTSAGGQNALGALLFHPEFYKAAVASCGCHDNRMDKIWWNEQWMGYPVDKSYEESSNTVNADKLQGKLMLFVGELDKNVDPASTLQVVDALIKANKDFEMLYVPGMGHSAGGKFGERKLRDFFIRHLRHDIPVDWNTVEKELILP